MPEQGSNLGAEERNKVNKRSAWIAEDEERHELAYALRIGVEKMRELAQEGKFMRPNPGEMEVVELTREDASSSGQTDLPGRRKALEPYTVYDLRVERACMPNPWSETIRDTSRLPFRTRLILEGWDEQLSGKNVTDEEGKLVKRTPGWVDNFDGEGSSIDEWCQAAFEEGLFAGGCYGFVDNDPRSFADPQSRARAGAQPRCILLRRSAIRRITISFAPDGKPRVEQLVFSQPQRRVDIQDPNAWLDEEVEALKVVTAGDPLAPAGSEQRKVRTQVYFRNEDGEWLEKAGMRATIEPELPGDELLEVPLVPLYVNRTGPFRFDSPFLDTAWMQNAIWNHMSEWLNKMREASLSYLHESGVQVDETSGKPVRKDSHSFRYRWSSEPGARLEIVENEGASLGAIMGGIDKLVRWVQDAHHQINSEKPTIPVTAREITLEGVHASSALEMWMIFQERGWQKILELMALLGGLPQRGIVSIPHDFGLPNTGMERNHQLFLAGRMTAKNYWAEAQRHGDVDEKKFDMGAEIELEKRSTPQTGRLMPGGGAGPAVNKPGVATVAGDGERAENPS